MSLRFKIVFIQRFEIILMTLFTNYVSLSHRLIFKLTKPVCIGAWKLDTILSHTTALPSRKRCSLNTSWTSAYKLSLLSSFLTELALQVVELGY